MKQTFKPQEILDNLNQAEETIKKTKIYLQDFIFPSKRPPYSLKNIVQECRKTREEMWKEEYEGKI